MSRARDFADLAGSADAGGISGKNLLINGSMAISQRGASLAVAHDGVTGGYLIDRWLNALGGTHEQLDATYAQVADHPLSANGKSLKWTTGTAESSYDADEYLYFAQKVEAQNLQHLNYGNSNAQSVTLSFYVKSSVTGTFACNLYKEDSTARIINKTYTISSANTWEKKSITFPADTGGGGIDNNTGVGLFVTWHLAAGANAKGGGSNGAWKNYGGLSDWADGQATNAVATTASATWQITDCQLEVGQQATPFEHRSYGDELQRCKRFLHRLESPDTTSGAFANLTGWDTSNVYGSVRFPVEMRAAPTVAYGAALSDFLILSAGANFAPTSIQLQGSNKFGVELNMVSTSNTVAGRSYWTRISDSTNGFIQFDAEL